MATLQPSLPKSPFLTFWFHPRQTVRAVAQTSEIDERLVIFLGMLSGFTRFLPSISDNPSQEAWLGIAFLAVLAGPAIGFFQLYLAGAILRWTGSWLAGQATSTTVRAAIALSTLPTTTFALAWLPIGVILGATIHSNSVVSSGQLVFIWSRILEFGMTIWSFLALLIGLSEAHQFSIGKAFVASALVFVVLLTPLFGCALLTQGWQVIMGR